MKKIVLTLLICAVVPACNISYPQPQASETTIPISTNDATIKETEQNTSIPSTETAEATEMPIEKYGCNDPSLTPEEVANCGQHVYAIEGNQVAGDCYYKLDDGSHVQSYSEVSTYTIIFDSGTVKTIGEKRETISIQLDPNVYEFKEDDSVTITTFRLDGWVDEFTWGDCKDIVIATIIQ